MAKNVRPSRLNPVYLLRRHAGTVFLFLALGLLSGIAFRSLVQPVRHSAEAEAPVRVAPPEQAEDFNWDAKRGELADLTKNPLLGSNLRHAVKLAATADAEIDGERLPEILLTAGTERGEIAANLDFQSLAVIVSDLDPPTGAEGWDFGFFREFRPETPEAAAVARADAGDPYFRVLFTLHRLLTGREANSAAEAWKTATDELAARLDREARFSGGGGFGPVAKRELLRELAAVPALAANSLYTVDDWHNREIAADIELTRLAPGSGTLRVAAEVDLHPVRFPRDSAVTRISPLTVAAVFATAAARENRPAAVAVEQPAAPAPVAEASEPAAEQPAVQPAAPIITYREEVDEAANRERLAAIAALEEAPRLAARDREACLRRLDLARREETGLSVEAMNARKRADRLRERYDNAAVFAAGEQAPKIPEEVRVLLVRRDEITRRLNELLAYCTAEHPFVKAAFREMAAVEATLGEYADAKTPAAGALEDARAARIANIHVEWEAASGAADVLEERRARQAEAVACLVEELENIEASFAKLEADLDAARAVPVPARRVAVETPAFEPRPRAAASEPEPEPAPVPAPAPAPEAAAPAPRLTFAVPAEIPPHTEIRDWNAVHWGVLGGLCLGLLISAFREIFTRRFATAADARRLVNLPLLAVLPAYDAKSFRRAAAAMKGEATNGKGGSVQFIPAPVELFEPPTEARRGRVLPAKRRPRVLVWVCGLILLIAAAFLHDRSGSLLARSGAGPAGPLPPPAATVPVWTEERIASQDRENMP